MVEVFPNLFIGDEFDYKKQVLHGFDRDRWSVVQACKEPYHRQALGYTTQGAPKDHPEYLIARRGNRLILNLVDIPDSAYIPEEIIKEALNFIHQELIKGRKVLVHCNMGESRAPVIGLLYLANTGKLKGTFEDLEKAFKELYPDYNPGKGMRDFASAHFLEEYLF